MMRTDRHSNPIASKYYQPSVNLLKAAGLQEGVDFSAGDTTEGVDTDATPTIKYTNPVVGFKGSDALLAGGQMNSWYANPKYGGSQEIIKTLASLSGQNVDNNNATDVYKNLPTAQRYEVIKKIYSHEGGTGALNNYASPVFYNFAKKVDQSRSQLKWTDTQILDYLAKKDPSIGSKIQQSRQTLYSNPQSSIKNDRDLVNYLAQKYDNKMPTVPSVAAGATGGAGPQYQPSQPGLAGKAAQLINTGYEKFTQLPGVKQFGQAVGRAAGAAGGAIGGIEGALLETGRQAIRAGQGKGFDIFQIARTAENIGKQTGQFGQTIGEAGAPAALTGGAGRLVNLALAYGMGYSGYDEFKQGYEQKDWVKMYSGLQNMVVAGLGFKEGFAEGNKGAIVDPAVKEQMKAEINFLKGKTPQQAAEQALAKSASIYREVLKPTKGELKKFEIQKGKNIDDVYKNMAKEGIIVGRAEGGKLDTVQARDIISDKIDDTNTKLSEALQSKVAKATGKPAKVFDLAQIKTKTKIAIDKLDLTELEKREMKQDVNDLINPEIEANGRFVDGMTANTVKRGMWRLGYRQDRPTVNRTSRMLGYTIKDLIEQRYKNDADIKGLNQKMADYIDMQSLLENAHGKTISGGVVGKGIARIVGATVGHTIPIPVIGTLVGEALGGKAYDYVTDPALLTKRASELAQPKQLPGSIAKRITETKLKGLSIEDVSGGKPGYELTDKLKNKIIRDATPDDYKLMENFIDYVRLKKPEDVNLETSVRSTLREMGINPDQPNNKIADIFDDLISRRSQIDKGIKSEIKGIPKELQPLAQEAKKYKSADEFVRAQGTPVYHGTKSKFDKFDMSKSNRDLYGKGFYLANNPDVAKKYAGENGVLMKFYVEPDSILKLDEPIKEFQKKNLKKVLGDNYWDWDKENNPERLYGRLQLTHKNPEKILQKAGIKGVEHIQQTISGNNKNYVIFDSSVIKTESQLTDLWNKVHGK